jgi:hypothetical protein
MADRHAVTVVESHAAPSQRVDVGGLPALSAVSSDWLTTDIIGKDQDNIRFNSVRLMPLTIQKKKEKQKGEPCGDDRVALPLRECCFVTGC